LAPNVGGDGDTQALRDARREEPTESRRTHASEGSDIDQALRRRACGACPGHVARIVLFTDGRATSGSLY
jgi:hypothetical protein